MPFALLMTDVLKRVEAGDSKAVRLRDRVIRLFRVITLRKPDAPVPVLACNLKAIGSAERPHYDELVERIRAAVKNRRAAWSVGVALSSRFSWRRLEIGQTAVLRSLVRKASSRFWMPSSRFIAKGADTCPSVACNLENMEVQFGAGQKAFVREAIVSGRLSNEEAAVTQALLLWEERERQRVEILAAVELAQQSLARGEGRGITTESELRQLADDVKRRGVARLAAERNPR